MDLSVKEVELKSFLQKLQIDVVKELMGYGLNYAVCPFQNKNGHQLGDYTFSFIIYNMNVGDSA